ncbi:MAG: hypothetical protein JW888_17780, partial [Pirellulales bacterium]|nr:hypothetical protein [Pirellulales bacterium]
MALIILLAWLTLPPTAANDLLNHLVASSDDKSLDKLEHVADEPFDEVDLRTVPDEALTIDEEVVADRAAISPAADA